MGSATASWTMRKEPFSGGARFSCPLDEPEHATCKLVRLDWSPWRPARDRRGRLLRVIDVPDSTPVDWEWLARTGREPFRQATSDPRGADLVGIAGGIEMDGGTYHAMGEDRVCRWELSRRLNRLRGRISLGVAAPVCARFANYIHRLNSDVRYVRVGRIDDQMAIQVVVPGNDGCWRDVATKALQVVLGILAPQTTWWSRDVRLVEALFREVGV